MINADFFDNDDHEAFFVPVKTRMTQCEYCMQWQPSSYCEIIDYCIGPDLLMHPVYLCEDCSEEIISDDCNRLWVEADQ